MFLTKFRQRGNAISEYLPIIGFVATVLIGGYKQFGDTAREQVSRSASELAGRNVETNAASQSNSGNGGSTSNGGSSGSQGGGGSSSSSGSNDNSGGGNTGTGGTSPGNGSDDAPPATTPPSTPPKDSSGDNGASGGSGGGGGGGGSGGGGDGSSGDDNSDGDDTTPSDESAEEVTDPEPEEENGIDDFVAWVGEFGGGVWDGLQTQFWELVRFNPIEAASDFIDLAVALVNHPEEVLAALREEIGGVYDDVTSGNARAIGRIVGENVSPATLVAVLNRVRRLVDASTRREIDVDCSSFTADTQVWTDQGPVDISQLNVGDRVLSRNDTTYQDSYQRIVKLKHRQAPGYYQIQIGGETLQVTGEHPFWVQAKGWTKAGTLTRGTAVAVGEGDLVVQSSEYIEVSTPVYNFTVENTHNYFVGSYKYWVHNENEACDLEARKRHVKEQTALALEYIPAADHDRFIQTLDDNTTLRNAILENPDLAQAWTIMDRNQGEVTSAVNGSPANLQALNDYIESTGVDPANLRERFNNTRDPELWLELKYTAAELDDTYRNTVLNNDTITLNYGTKEHKAQRWANYLESNPDADYAKWSNVYDGGIGRHASARESVRTYIDSIGLNLTDDDYEVPRQGIEIELRGESVVVGRRHDAVDPETGTVYEVKNYTSANVALTKDIEREVRADAELLARGGADGVSEVVWYFADKGPSGPLRRLLEESGITIRP